MKTPNKENIHQYETNYHSDQKSVDQYIGNIDLNTISNMGLQDRLRIKNHVVLKLNQIENDLKKVLNEIGHKFKNLEREAELQINSKELIIQNQRLLNLIQRIHQSAQFLQQLKIKKQESEIVIESSQSFIQKIYQLDQVQQPERQMLITTQRLNELLVPLKVTSQSQNRQFQKIQFILETCIRKIYNISIIVHNLQIQYLYHPPNNINQANNLQQIQELYTDRIQKAIDIKDNQIKIIKSQYQQKYLKFKDSSEIQIQRLKNQITLKNAFLNQIEEINTIKQNSLLNEIQILRNLTNNLQQSYKSDRLQLQETILNQQIKMNSLIKYQMLFKEKYQGKLQDIRKLIDVPELKKLASLSLNKSYLYSSQKKSSGAKLKSENQEIQNYFISQRNKPINQFSVIKQSEYVPKNQQLAEGQFQWKNFYQQYNKIGQKVQQLISQQQIWQRNIQKACLNLRH